MTADGKEEGREAERGRRQREGKRGGGTSFVAVDPPSDDAALRGGEVREKGAVWRLLAVSIPRGGAVTGDLTGHTEEGDEGKAAGACCFHEPASAERCVAAARVPLIPTRPDLRHRALHPSLAFSSYPLMTGPIQSSMHHDLTSASKFEAGIGNGTVKP